VKAPAHCLGIDLGTTNSAVALLVDGRAQVLKPYGSTRDTLPSVVYYPEGGGEPVVGVRAQAQGPIHPTRTIYSAKRFIGRKFAEVEHYAPQMPFKVVATAGGDAAFEIDGRIILPQEVSAEVLKKLKSSAEQVLCGKVESAVITVPAYFNDAQRKATVQAAELAGLKVDRLVAEPTAAALQCAFETGRTLTGQTVAVFDLGGGTFDVSVLRFGQGETGNVIQVLATDGDSFLGGDDLDQLVCDHVVDKVKEQTGVDLRSDPPRLQELRRGVERAKTEGFEVPVEVTLADGRRVPITLAPADRDRLVGEFLKKTAEPCQRVLQDVKAKGLSVDQVVAVGGMAHLEAVRTKVQELFGTPVFASTNPDLAVAHGAAIQSGQIHGKISEKFVMSDVTPLSLGVELVGNVFAKMIPRNSPLPIIKSQNFTTSSDDQNYAEIRVLQGERPLASENKLVGSFVLSNLRRGTGGRRPDIKVTFKLNEDGLLEVSAVDAVTGHSQNTVVFPSDGLTKPEIEEQLRLARERQDDDAQRLQWGLAKNEGEALLHELGAVLPRLSTAGQRTLKPVMADVRRLIDGPEAQWGGLRAAVDRLRARKSDALRELTTRA